MCAEGGKQRLDGLQVAVAVFDFGRVREVRIPLHREHHLELFLDERPLRFLSQGWLLDSDQGLQRVRVPVADALHRAPQRLHSQRGPSAKSLLQIPRELDEPRVVFSRAGLPRAGVDHDRQFRDGPHRRRQGRRDLSSGSGPGSTFREVLELVSVVLHEEPQKLRRSTILKQGLSVVDDVLGEVRDDDGHGRHPLHAPSRQWLHLHGPGHGHNPTTGLLATGECIGDAENVRRIEDPWHLSFCSLLCTIGPEA
mmetsp:Transcript_56824/g.163107  ORF Transcript_56824/g.163107 Transcript_56824/m.163107 type:complete len:253 (-) Transcript_56824:565-1323(-)